MNAPSPEALAFCLRNTFVQIRDAHDEARLRGLRAPTEAEREQRRELVALDLLRGPSPEGRRLAAAYLMEGAA